MFRRRTIAASGLWIALCASLLSHAPAEPLPAAAVEGLLLLKNGETLAGSISRSGDYYLVVTPTAELQIRVRDAEAVCADFEQAFAHKKALSNPSLCDSRLELAQWCIDRGLYGHAARELVEAQRLDDLNPRVALVDRRLQAAMAAPRPTPVVAKPALPQIPDSELEAAVQSISPEALHEFTVRAQPLLMNYCATAGCHGPRAASEFKLERAYLNELNNPRVVRLNLNAVLKQIDRRSPASSKLLTVPISPHGGGMKAIFHVHNAEQYRALAAWVARAAQGKSPPPVATTTNGAAASGTLLQRLPIHPPGVPTPVHSPQPSPPSASAPPPNSPVPQSPTLPPSADPFDPELFNRLPPG